MFGRGFRDGSTQGKVRYHDLEAHWVKDFRLPGLEEVYWYWVRILLNLTDCFCCVYSQYAVESR
jgi:hypothetical protein